MTPTGFVNTYDGTCDGVAQASCAGTTNCYWSTTDSACERKTHPEGFEVTGGIWVDDSDIYASCHSSWNLPAGCSSTTTPCHPAMTNGVTGVWDRYQDYYSGSASNPAPVVPVLIPMSCADVN